MKKNIIQRIFKNYGRLKSQWLELKTKTLMDNGFPQSIVFPKATFSPWANDTEFNKLYGKVKSMTMVDKYRCYEIWQLSKGQSKLE